MEPNEIISVTLVGLSNAENGRSCEDHIVCGHVVEISTALRFMVTIIRRNNHHNLEYAIGAYHVVEGRTTCLVGFLPARCAIGNGLRIRLGKWCQLTELPLHMVPVLLT